MKKQSMISDFYLCIAISLLCASALCAVAYTDALIENEALPAAQMSRATRPQEIETRLRADAGDARIIELSQPCDLLVNPLVNQSFARALTPTPWLAIAAALSVVFAMCSESRRKRRRASNNSDPEPF